MPFYKFLLSTFVMFSLFGCSTTTLLPTKSHQFEYRKIEIENNTIIDIIKPGMSISVETKDAVIRCIVAGYENDHILVCTDEYGQRQERVNINDIKEVRVEVKVKEPEMPAQKIVTYTSIGHLIKQQLISIINYPRLVFVPTKTKQKLIFSKSDAQKELEHYVKRNYSDLANEAKTNCSKHINALYSLYTAYIETEYSAYVNDYSYIPGTYDQLTKELFCSVLKDDFELLFEFNDLFLSTLARRVHKTITPSDFDHHIAFENDCEGIGDTIREKAERNIESFSMTCSDGVKRFQCDFQDKIVYDSKGIPYKKELFLRMETGVLAKSYTLQPACWRSEPLSIILRLAVLNGCKNIDDVSKTNTEGSIESFIVDCSNGSIGIQCNFQGKIYFGYQGQALKEIIGKSYKAQSACWLSK
ncbi:MAG: hypothetical protein OEY89_06935 [Gammaproteobacteria bacterium]|nr:hypothetical protein [Gammaproteobacteria bacterium]